LGKPPIDIIRLGIVILPGHSSKTLVKRV